MAVDQSREAFLPVIYESVKDRKGLTEERLVLEVARAGGSYINGGTNRSSVALALVKPRIR